MKYPKAREDQQFPVWHGTTIADPYQWMRDVDSPQLRAWVAEENKLSDRFFKDHDVVYQKYAKRNRQKESIPSYSNITKTMHGYMVSKQIQDCYQILEVDEQFQTLRDFSAMLKTIEHTTFFSGAICPNDPSYAFFHGLIDGYDRPSIFLFDLKQERCIRHIDGIFCSMFDCHGKKVLFGDARVETHNKRTINHLKCYDFVNDEIRCLFTYPDNAIMIAPQMSQDGNHLVSDVTVDYSRHQLYFATEDGFVPYNKGPQCVQYCGSFSDAHILCSFEDNEHGQIKQVSKDFKQERILFESDEIFIQEARVVNEEIYIFAVQDVNSVIYRYKDGKCTSFPLPAMCTASLISERIAHQQELFLMVESFTKAPQLYRIQKDACTPVGLITPDASSYIQVDQVFYPSQDGTRIPAYLVYRKDCDRSKPLPTLMYGYGGYNVPSTPSYHNPFIGMDIVDWVNDGGLYVNCCIRGGNEYGETWHIEGYKQKKKNCYYDFIGIAEGIIQDGWTIPEKIGICGGSNGGLLMCALLTMRPDLWGCVIASVPHTDMLSFAQDDRGPMYITEYGDPDDEEQFRYFLSYSPFHNIQRINYPCVYIQTGECDNNVPPYHGKKMAARLQQYNTSKNAILLRVLAKGSHDRGKGEAYLQTISEMQSFLALALTQDDTKEENECK